MKKTSFALWLALAAFPAFAAEQYSFVHYGSGDNLYSVITFSETTVLSMDVLGVVDNVNSQTANYNDNGNHKDKGKGKSLGVKNNNKNDGPGSTAFSGRAADAFSTFGYYVNDAYVDLSEQLAKAMADLSSAPIDLGVFSVDDTIRFVQSADGMAYGLESKNSNSPDFVAAYNRSNYTQVDLSGMHYDGSMDVAFTASSFGSRGSDAPTGQPLPGVLATLLIGGSLFGVSRFRRRPVR